MQLWRWKGMCGLPRLKASFESLQRLEAMNSPQPHPPPAPSAPDNRRHGSAGEGTTSLVFAIIAPFGVVMTAYPATLATLLTYPDEGPSDRPWIAPLVLWSLPLLFGFLSVTLALAALRGAPAGSASRKSAVGSLWINGGVFAVGLALTMPFLSSWLFG